MNFCRDVTTLQGHASQCVAGCPSGTTFRRLCPSACEVSRTTKYQSLSKYQARNRKSFRFRQIVQNVSIIIHKILLDRFTIAVSLVSTVPTEVPRAMFNFDNFPHWFVGKWFFYAWISIDLLRQFTEFTEHVQVICPKEKWRSSRKWRTPRNWSVNWTLKQRNIIETFETWLQCLSFIFIQYWNIFYRFNSFHWLFALFSGCWHPSGSERCSSPLYLCTICRGTKA